jgi:hypothetical protein
MKTCQRRLHVGLDPLKHLTFLPIVDRELRVAARRHSTYSIRLVVALAALAVSVFLYAVTPGASRASAATYILEGISVTAFIYCLFAGRRFTADCLSGEKREGTLGLLFLTDLKGYDVVLGKLVATSLNGFYGLLAIVPMLALPLLLGGVSQGEVWRLVLVLVSAFLFSLAVGVFASVLSQDARRAMGTNLLLLLLLAASPPACAGAIVYASPSHWFVSELLYSCPAYPLYLSFDTWYVMNKEDYWLSVGVIQVLTWLLVALASWIAPRSWQDRPSVAGKRQWRDRWEAWIYGDALARKDFRTRLLNQNAFYWLAARVRIKPAGVWMFLTFMGGWWLYVGLKMNIHWADEAFALVTAIMLNSVFKLWIAIEAGQRLAEDRKIGALELLLSTPLGVRDILHGQMLALRRQFLRPLLVVLAAELLLMILVSRHSYQSPSVVIIFGSAGILLLAIDIATLIWVGFLSALTAKNPNYASVTTIFRVMILPWIIWGAISAGISALALLSGSDGPGWKFYLHLWFWLGIATDLAFGLPAWHQVRTGLRQFALQRPAPMASKV